MNNVIPFTTGARYKEGSGAASWAWVLSDEFLWTILGKLSVVTIDNNKFVVRRMYRRYGIKVVKVRPWGRWQNGRFLRTRRLALSELQKIAKPTGTQVSW